MTDTAVVNNNTVSIYPSAKGNEDETAARRVASDLARNDPAVERVGTSVMNYATVWLADDFGADGGNDFKPPEGYAIDDVFVSSHGAIAVHLSRVDG